MGLTVLPDGSVVLRRAEFTVHVDPQLRALHLRTGTPDDGLGGLIVASYILDSVQGVRLKRDGERWGGHIVLKRGDVVGLGQWPSRQEAESAVHTLAKAMAVPVQLETPEHSLVVPAGRGPRGEPWNPQASDGTIVDRDRESSSPFEANGSQAVSFGSDPYPPRYFSPAPGYLVRVHEWRGVRTATGAFVRALSGSVALEPDAAWPPFLGPPPAPYFAVAPGVLLEHGARVSSGDLMGAEPIGSFDPLDSQDLALSLREPELAPSGERLAPPEMPDAGSDVLGDEDLALLESLPLLEDVPLLDEVGWSVPIDQMYAPAQPGPYDGGSAAELGTTGEMQTVSEGAIPADGLVAEGEAAADGLVADGLVAEGEAAAGLRSTVAPWSDSTPIPSLPPPVPSLAPPDPSLPPPVPSLPPPVVSTVPLPEPLPTLPPALPPTEDLQLDLPPVRRHAMPDFELELFEPTRDQPGPSAARAPSEADWAVAYYRAVAERESTPESLLPAPRSLDEEPDDEPMETFEPPARRRSSRPAEVPSGPPPAILQIPGFNDDPAPSEPVPAPASRTDDRPAAATKRQDPDPQKPTEATEAKTGDPRSEPSPILLQLLLDRPSDPSSAGAGASSARPGGRSWAGRRTGAVIELIRHTGEDLPIASPDLARRRPL